MTLKIDRMTCEVSRWTRFGQLKYNKEREDDKGTKELGSITGRILHAGGWADGVCI